MTTKNERKQPLFALVKRLDALEKAERRDRRMPKRVKLSNDMKEKHK